MVSDSYSGQADTTDSAVIVPAWDAVMPPWVMAVETILA